MTDDSEVLNGNEALSWGARGAIGRAGGALGGSDIRPVSAMAS